MTRMKDFSTVTESPGALVSAEALDMVLTRYTFAADVCRGKRVLEVACGPGPGLGLLASAASRVVAGDYTWPLLAQARAEYGEEVPLVRLDAGALPFAEASFDVILLFEAIYFLPDVPAFLAACRRVLSPGGRVVMVTVNPEWDEFNPSSSGTRYWSAPELEEVLAAEGFASELLGAFPAHDTSVRGQIMGAAKRVAVRLGLIPKTMKGKEWLKRIAFGKLTPFPARVTSALGTYCAPVPLDRAQGRAGFKVLYAVGTLGADTKHA